MTSQEVKTIEKTLERMKKLPIHSSEWASYFDESGHLRKSREYISAQILERGLHPSVRSEAWKFLTGYYSWRSSSDERLTVDSARRKSYESLCNICEKIQPLLETDHRDFNEVQNFIKSDVQRLYIKDAEGNTIADKSQLEKLLMVNYMCNVEAEYQQGFHEMLLLFLLLVEKEHEIYWLFQFFLQKTKDITKLGHLVSLCSFECCHILDFLLVQENSCILSIGVERNLTMLRALIAYLDPVFSEHLEKKGRVVQSLFPWFCLFFQRVFKSFDDVWRLWEVFLTGLPCRNLQVIVAYTMLQMVRDQIIREDMNADDILTLCNNIIDLEANDVIFRARNTCDLLFSKKEKVPKELMEFFGDPQN